MRPVSCSLKNIHLDSTEYLQSFHRLSNIALKEFRDGAFTIDDGSLFHVFTTLLLKSFCLAFAMQNLFLNFSL